MSLLRFFNAAGQTFRGIGENPLVRGSLGLMSANAPGQAAPVDQTGSFLKGMLSANALRQNRLLQEEQAKERERQEEQRVATQEFFQNVAKRPQMVADRQNQIAQMVAQRELTPFNAADMRATLPADMQARSMGDVGQQTPIHSEPLPIPDAIPTITQMALTSGVPSIQNSMLQNMMATPDTTAAYKDAVAIGLIPGTEEFNTYMTDRTIGSQKRFQDKAEIMQQERQFKLYQGAQDSAINAANMAGDLNQINELLAGWTGGPLAEADVSINRFFTETLNLPIGTKDDTAKAELAKTISNKLTIANRGTQDGGGMPGAMSDRDLKFLIGMVPQLSTTLQGRQLIARAAQIMADAKAQQALRIEKEYQAKGFISAEFLFRETAITNAAKLEAVKPQMRKAAGQKKSTSGTVTIER
tara:strand:+ start:61 stop:1302 length:1242 start_codon:yes stop_codon:yes gene_type:complete